VPPAFSILSLATWEKLVRADRELLGELALAKDLHDFDLLGHESTLLQRGQVHGGAGVERLLEGRDVDRERLDPERVLEAALGDSRILSGI
jgi:hypothetical protein